MNDWHPFRYKLVLNAVNTTQEDLLMPHLAEQWEHRITNVALVNATSATTYARLKVSAGLIEYFHREWRTLSAANLYYDNTLDLPIAPEEVAGIAFFGATAGDLLTVYIRGLRRPI